MSAERLFRSFWLGGFEGATHITRAGRRLDMVASTEHDQRCAFDYGVLRDLGITTVRESARWHLMASSRASSLNLLPVMPMWHAAEQHRMQVVWTFFHYGWPDDIELLSDRFIDAFVTLCQILALANPDRGSRPVYIPMNEISFFSWAAGEVGHMFPFYRGRGLEVKRHLVRALLAGIDAIRRADPTAIIVTSEPLIHVVPPHGPDVDRAPAQRYHDSQFEAFDMLTGRSHPDLGGHESYLEHIGVNYYYDNQWEWPGGTKLAWHPPHDARRKALSTLLEELARRYERPIVLSETGHFGPLRGAWLDHIVDDLAASDVQLEGICLYPVISRHDWDDPTRLNHDGLYTRGEGLHAGHVDALRRAQARLK